MKAGMVAVIVLALGSAGAAVAQTQQPDERIDAAMARARQAGVPVSLLESKLAEGKAKGVAMDRIAAAIDRRESALEKAHDALRGQQDATASLAVGADAIEAGVSEGVLKAVADAAPRDRRNVAIAALTELVRQGQLPDAALQRVRDALKRGPDALANLPAEAAAGQSHAGSGAPSDRGPGSSNGRSGGQASPPAGVPAPGAPPQAGKPGGAPSNPGRPANPGRGGR
jgi:hypothetical protein